MLNSLLLLSGGLDSTALAYEMRPAMALTVDYGQRAARGEFAASAAIAQELRIEHITATVRPENLGVGAMTHHPHGRMNIPSEWWPYRNQLLVTLGSTLAVRHSIECVIIGTVREDSQYVDGTAAFVESLNGLLIAQEGRVRLLAPAINLTSAELLTRSCLPHSLAALTRSCARAEVACGNCNSCEKARNILSTVYETC